MAGRRNEPLEIERKEMFKELTAIWEPRLEPEEKISVDWYEVETGVEVSFDAVIIPWLEHRFPHLRSKAKPDDPWLHVLQTATETGRSRLWQAARAAGEPDPLIGFSFPASATPRPRPYRPRS